MVITDLTLLLAALLVAIRLSLFAWQRGASMSKSAVRALMVKYYSAFYTRIFRVNFMWNSKEVASSGAYHRCYKKQADPQSEFS